MSQQDLLFNSLEKPIPGIRGNLDIIPVQESGKSYLYFHDMMGYATPNFALERSAGQILSLFNGQRSINELSEYLDDDVSVDQFLQYIRFLDKNRLLYSEFYKTYSNKIETEYEQKSERTPTSSGLSYPADPHELKEQFDQAFNEHEVPVSLNGRKVKALYAPHIDPRVGFSSYVKAFAPLRNLKPKRVVVIATSHYSGLYPDTYDNQPFILSDKTFQLPHGDVPSDQQAVQELIDKADELGISGNDRAHRIEHSIELHLVFLKYLWDHDFSMVPILVGSFGDLLYKRDGHLGKQLDQLSTHLRNKYADDDETLFLISGDLAHIGKKFGDPKAANTMFEEVKAFDKKFMRFARDASHENILDLMQDTLDPYRICGFPPLYTFLNAFPDLKGQQLSYDLWDESERESAVTFGSLLYTK